MRIAVIGASGVLGRQVVPRLLERGHTVRAMVRENVPAFLDRPGVEIVSGDILKPETLPDALAGVDAVLNLATAVPRPGTKPDFTLNDRIRRDGTRFLLEACRAAGVSRLVQQSIAFITADGSDRWLDEDSPPHPNLIGASAVEMEAALAASDRDWIVVRGGLFYGPGTGRDAAWRMLARDDALTLPGDGSAYVSLIHVADMAAAMIAALENAPGKTILNAVDDEPVRYRDLLVHVATLEGRPAPRPGGPSFLPSFRVSNARMRRMAGWSPFFRTYRSGLAGGEG